MEKYRKQCAEKGLPDDDETVVLFAMFPQQVEALAQGQAGCGRHRCHRHGRDATAAPTAAASEPGIGACDSGPAANRQRRAVCSSRLTANATRSPSKRWKADSQPALYEAQSARSRQAAGRVSAVSYEDWRKLVEAELKGAPFDKKMFTSTYEGITLKPHLPARGHRPACPTSIRFPASRRSCAAPPPAATVKKPWDVSQEIAFSSPTEFNHAARNSISRGLNALNMVLDQATATAMTRIGRSRRRSGLGGLSIATLGDLDRALEGIDLEKTSLLVRSGASAMPFAALLVALARKRKKTLTGLRGCIEMDPLGVLSHEAGCRSRSKALIARWRR